MTHEHEPIRRRDDGSIEVCHYAERARAARTLAQREALHRLLRWWRAPRKVKPAEGVLQGTGR